MYYSVHVGREHEFVSEKIGKLLCAQDVDPIRRLQPCPVVVIQDGCADGGSSAVLGAKILIAEGYMRRNQIAVRGFRKCLFNLLLLFTEIRAARIRTRDGETPDPTILVAVVRSSLVVSSLARAAKAPPPTPRAAMALATLPNRSL